MEKTFYVYEYYIISTNTVFYVGKGTGKRYKNTWARNDDFKRIIEENKENYDVRIVKYFDNEDDSFAYENELIAFYRDKLKLNLCNKNYGGLGGVSGVWTEEKRKYQSVHNPMKAEEQRERMRKNNPSKNPETFKKKAIKNGTVILFYGKKYYTFKELADAWGVTQNTVSVSWRNRLELVQKLVSSPTNKNGPFTEEEKESIKNGLLRAEWDKKPKYTKGNGFSIFGVDYISKKQATEILQVDKGTILKWKEREKEILEKYPEIKGVQRPLTNKEKYRIGHTSSKAIISHKKRTKRPIINDIEYDNVNLAGEALNIPPNTIRYRCDSPNFPNYYFLDNQQPSQ